MSYYIKRHALIIGVLLTFSLSVNADEVYLQRQIESLQQDKNRLEKERWEIEARLEKKHVENLARERLHLRQEYTDRHNADFKLLLSHLKEQLAYYNLYLTFGGTDGGVLTISPIPSEETNLAKEKDIFAQKNK